MESLSKWIKQLQASWNVLFGAAAAIMATLGSFLVPPPVDNQLTGALHYDSFAKFVVAIVVGLVVCLSWQFSERRYMYYWWVCTLLLLAAVFFAFHKYQELTNHYVHHYSGGMIYVGSKYTDHGALFHKKHPELSIEDILYWHHGEAKQVWTPDTIYKTANWIAELYILSVICVATCLVAITQAIFCSTNTNGPVPVRKTDTVDAPPPEVKTPGLNREPK